MLRNEGPDSEGQLSFTDCGRAVGVDVELDARGMASWDFDHDGDLDLVINHNPGDSGNAERARPVLLRNDLENGRPWLQVELVGTRSHRDALGAMVSIESGGKRQIRHVHAGSAYASQSSSRVHFGLGEAERVDRLEVRWPDGKTEEYSDFSSRQLVRITEDGGMQQNAFPEAREEIQP